jgi:two-component system LytT family sensor kinase
MTSHAPPFRPVFGLSHPWPATSATAGLSDYGWSKPLNDERRAHLHLALILCGAFTLLAAYSALLVHVVSANSPKPAPWSSAIFSEFTYCYLALAMSPVVVMLKQRFPLRQKKVLRNLPIHLLAMVAFSTAAKGLWDLLAGPPSNYAHAAFTYQKMVYSIASYSDFGGILYWMIVLIAVSLDLYGRYERQAVNAARLQAQLAQAQVQSLKMQLHPHFLFNTLNSISALVRDHPETAETMIARLSDLLRRTLESTSTQEIALRQELEFLRLYLDIEQARFEDRLSVQFNIDPDALNAMVPNMILQPLVENAIRHGIANRVEKGEICISARRRGGDLLLKVADNGTGLSPSSVLSIKQGVGLASTKGRLERLYGARQALQLEAPDGGGFVARIVVPFVTHQ